MVERFQRAGQRVEQAEAGRVDRSPVADAVAVHMVGDLAEQRVGHRGRGLQVGWLRHQRASMPTEAISFAFFAISSS